MENKLYSVVIPVFNSEKIVAETVAKTLEAFKQFGLNPEIVLVNDGSTDNSWSIIKSLAETHPEVKSYKLLKNYGQHTAVYCGIEKSTGDFIITMDDDMQNPPEEIIKLIRKIYEGYDLVFAEFESKQHAGYRKLGTRMIDALNIRVFNKPKELKLTNFRIFSRSVANRMLTYNTNFPYIPGLLLLHASKMANTLTLHQKRAIGSSNYNLVRILTLVSRLLFSYSTYPMKFLSTIGGLIAGMSFLTGLFFILKAVFYGSNVQGWTTIMVMLSFFNGFLILMMGVMGQYIGRILNRVSVEKPYFVKESVE